MAETKATKKPNAPKEKPATPKEEAPTPFILLEQGEDGNWGYKSNLPSGVEGVILRIAAGLINKLFG